ncbi:MAG TPA: carboxypeptidase-like regulatory domain-containing protein [Terriglobales bacterium]|nr:carboxypeptidase-like regulatory domain-containing protein [Terriglobales bacterium]
MSHKRAWLAGFFCSCVFSTCSLLYGQASGSFSGTVVDTTGSVVSGATVKVTSQGTGLSRETKTDDTGHYLIPLLPVAYYTIRVESQGFQAVEQKDVRLQVDEHRELDFTVTPASVTTTVEVSASEVAVQTTNPTLGQVITEQQVAQLPLNGRDFVQLATLTPGVTQETNPNSFFNGGPSSEVSTRGSYSLSVGGSRAQSTDWLLDGNDNNELTAGGISILPSIDAIQEFKVLTYNYSAEYGTRSGPTVLVTTKSGSNQFHGSLFEFFRNTSLDARSYFATEREKFNLNQYGGALGGPIRKDKTFFFIDYQGRNQRKGVPFAGLVPTSENLTGNFNSDAFGIARGNPSDPNSHPHLTNPYTLLDPVPPTGMGPQPFQCQPDGVTPLAINSSGHQAGGTPCSVIPDGLKDPVGTELVKLYPGALFSGQAASGAGFNFASVPVRKLDEREFDVRLDHNFSTKDSLFARFSYDQAVNFVPGGSPGFAEPSTFASNQNISNHGRNAAISETHIFSDHNINQFNAGFNRIFNVIKSQGDGSCAAANIGPGIPGADINSKCPNAPQGLTQSTTFCVSCGLTAVSLNGGYWGLGDRGFAPFQGGTNVFSISDSFDMIRGKHDIRVGMGFRANQMNVMTNAFQDGSFSVTGLSGDAMADLVMGLYTFGLHDQTFKGATTGRRWKLFRPFVDDTWRVTPNLTLNLGVAWALVTPITEAQNRQANFNFYSTCTPSPDCNQLIPGVNSDGRVGVQFDKTAIEPRIGLAWKVLGRQNTALRAGYAIFHDSSWNQGGQGLWENPPFFAESVQGSFFCMPPTLIASPAANICNISTGFPVLTTPPTVSTFGGTVWSQNLDFKQGIVQQYNLNIEQQLPGNVVLTTGYAGSHSTHILVDGLNMNVGSPDACNPAKPSYNPAYKLGCSPGGGPLSAPYNIFYVANSSDTGSARYDSLQIKAETKSARHGLYALLGYTWSHTFDSGYPDGLGSSSGATYWPLPGTARNDWGLSQINLNQQFTASVIYDLPFGKGKAIGSGWNGPVNALLGGWQATVIEKITTGFPVFIVNSVNQSGVNFEDNFATNNRPIQTCDPTSVHQTIQRWFNPDCFTQAPVGELGTASRTPLSGPRFVNTDFSLIKRFAITERVGADFRTEFFNLFNHPQFGLPNADLASPFGSQVNGNLGTIIYTVNNPRLIQLALKITF